MKLREANIVKQITDWRTAERIWRVQRGAFKMDKRFIRTYSLEPGAAVDSQPPPTTPNLWRNRHTPRHHRSRGLQKCLYQDATGRSESHPITVRDYTRHQSATSLTQCICAVYWVWFDEPQFDAGGGDPYKGGQVWVSTVSLQVDRPN